ncbi:MAG: hypothetical protein FJ290_32920, partial [Planctomycetes bacterium]|nr:hypothetical protein [Planctomycetota bacterium]
MRARHTCWLVVASALAATLASRALAQERPSAWRLYDDASEALFTGGARDKVAQLFADAAKQEPDSHAGKMAAELATLLADMAREDATFREPDNVAALSQE